MTDVGAELPPSVGYADISPSRGEIGCIAGRPHVYPAFVDRAPTMPRNVGRWALGRLFSISPLEGEMAGRPEGGVAANWKSEAR